MVGLVLLGMLLVMMISALISCYKKRRARRQARQVRFRALFQLLPNFRQGSFYPGFLHVCLSSVWRQTVSLPVRTATSASACLCCYHELAMPAGHIDGML